MCDKIQTKPHGDQCFTQSGNCSDFRTSSNQICKNRSFGNPVCEGGDYCWPTDLTVDNAGWKYGLHLDSEARAIINNNKLPSGLSGYKSDCVGLGNASCGNSWTDSQWESAAMSGIDIAGCIYIDGKCWDGESATNEGVVTFNPDDEYNSCSKLTCPAGQIKDPAKNGTVCRTATGCTAQQCCMLHDCDEHGPPYGTSEEVWAEWVHRCPRKAAEEMTRQCATNTYSGKAPYGTHDEAVWAQWVRKCPKEAAGCGGNKDAGVPWGASEKDWANWVRWCPARVKDMNNASCADHYPHGTPWGASEHDWAVWDRMCNSVQAPDPLRCTTSPDVWAMDGGNCPEP